MSFSFKTIQPIMVAGSTALHVDARTLFETYGMPGRFRDWVRRTLKPYMEGLRAPLHRYVKDENPKQRNYYFEATYMIPVIEVCIRPRIDEDTVAPANPVVPVATVVHAEVESSLNPSITQRLNAFLAKAESASQAVVAKSVSELISGLNSMLVPHTDTHSLSFRIAWHPFSVNYMYERIPGSSKPKRSRNYNNWCHKVHSLIPEAPVWFNPSAPLNITLHFGHVHGYDVDNLAKSAIDAISRKWGFNDILVQNVTLSHEVVPRNSSGEGSDLANGFIRYTVTQ